MIAAAGGSLNQLDHPDFGSMPFRGQRIGGAPIEDIHLTVFGHRVTIEERSETKITAGSEAEGWVLIEQCPTRFCNSLHARESTLLPKCENTELERVSKDTLGAMYSDASCPEMKVICQQLCAMSDDEFAQIWQLFIRNYAVNFHDFIQYLQKIDEALLPEEIRLSLSSKLGSMVDQQAVTLMNEYNITVRLNAGPTMISEHSDANCFWNGLLGDALFSFLGVDLQLQDNDEYCPLGPHPKLELIRDVQKKVHTFRLNELCSNGQNSDIGTVVLSTLSHIAQVLLDKGYDAANAHLAELSQRLPYKYELLSTLTVAESRLSVARNEEHGFTAIDLQFATQAVRLNNKHETQKEMYGSIQLVRHHNSPTLDIRYAVLSSDKPMQWH